MGAVIRNLFYGIKAIFFLKVPQGKVDTGPASLWFAVFLFILTHIVLSAVYVWEELWQGRLEGLSDYDTAVLAMFLAILLLNLLIAQSVAQNQESALRYAIIYIHAYTILVPLEWLGEKLLFEYYDYTDELYIKCLCLFGVWLFLVGLKLALSQLSCHYSYKFFLPLVVSVSLVYPLWLFYGNPWLLDINYEQEEQYEEEEDPVYLNAEQTFIRQGHLLKEVLAEIKPSKEGEVDAFVISAGTYGHERVFLREATLAGEVLGKAFQAEGRSLTLYNHVETAEEVPIATYSNLHQALQDFKAKAQEEDLLVLYITSHGSPGFISVQLSGIGLINLTVENLKRLLDESGFKWKVLIVSACYSGSYINPFKDDNTIIVTAASGDRPSYGCSDTSELTNFGRALLDDGLQLTNDLIAAFLAAKIHIKDEEREGGYLASYPQISVGRDICLYMREKGYLTEISEETCLYPRLNDEFIGVPFIDRVLSPMIRNAGPYTEEEQESNE